MKRLLPGFVALVLWGCSREPLPDATEGQARAAIRECEVRAPWWFGPVYGFDIPQGVSFRLRGLTGPEFDRTARCLSDALRVRGVDAMVENADVPEPPIELIEVGGGNRILVPPREAPEPVWLDMNGMPIATGR